VEILELLESELRKEILSSDKIDLLFLLSNGKELEY
jgi:hypothetical protein